MYVNIGGPGAQWRLPLLEDSRPREAPSPWPWEALYAALSAQIMASTQQKSFNVILIVKTMSEESFQKVAENKDLCASMIC